MRTDVCLILEGSYPYVVGGVSTWAHHLIKSLPDIDFTIVYVGVSRHHVQRMEYKLPENVREFHEIYLLDPVIIKNSRKWFRRPAWDKLERFVRDMEQGDLSRVDVMVDLLTGGVNAQISPYDIMYSRKFWDILLVIYRKHFNNLSFIDFFWTCRFLMLPLFQIIHCQVPESRVYHASCTGYAGLLGVLGKIKHRSPFILTEHGIYTNERMIEISQASYIYNEVVVDLIPRRKLGLLQNVWMRKFALLSGIAYNKADQIITLYEGNRQTQLQHGADPEKCILIPNGIDVARYAQLQDGKPRDRAAGMNVAYVGRISPIKDVKTYLRAARVVLDQRRDVTFYILGTPDEDVEYYEECRALAEMLELGDRMVFAGNVDMGEYYPKLDAVVLTSVSEAQPFVIIEAMSVGVPVVATNVGACSELLFGGTPEDQRLGRAGELTNVNSPEETAKAILRLLGDSESRESMARAGRERAFRYYQRQSVVNRYRDVYRGLMSDTRSGQSATMPMAGPRAEA